MRNYLIFILFISLNSVFAQELECKVTVNAAKVTNVNNQIFKNLETSLNDLVNKTAWTDLKFKNSEKINCSMFITVNEYNSNNFSASIQVQSSRPGYNSTFSTPVLNVNDKDFNFKYVEFENLNYNPNGYDSNLISVIAFYSTLIIGLDLETFKPNGGDEVFQITQNILNVAAQGGYKGWSQADGNQNRYFIITDILSPSFKSYREALFQYHFNGIDQMAGDIKTAKSGILESLDMLTALYSVRPNSYLLRTFFDAKSDEIVAIFSGGPIVPIPNLIDNLNRISPTNSSKWSKIKL